MPMSNEQLNEHLQALRSKGSESMGVIEDEFGVSFPYNLCSKQFSPTSIRNYSSFPVYCGLDAELPYINQIW